MTPDEVAKLQLALSDRFPGVALRVTTRGGLAVVAATSGVAKAFKAPPTLDYRALDWREWLHRFTLELEKAKLS